MDRAQQQAVASSLMFREGETVAEILQAYHALVLIATDRITNKASIGHAAHNSMAMQLETQRLIKGVENLLALTRRIRELWIVGPLRQLEGGRDLEEKIATEVQSVISIMNQMRSNTRQQYVSAGGGYGQYVEGPLTAPLNAPPNGPAVGPSNGPPNGQTAPAP
ncbi:hypothetical protein N0V93_005315 [Gnomoniopsis smithogilvyi]|uniref:Uncharacterized protein n=1 Tax=Gnomoniopsis smithogilvyi TaxID=1191159 RepID=A0A9W8YUD5_9PEZI|nr:hypothetical protein N0V93_005315 [Gnomoniopsis smithogilvyi]